MNRTPVGPGRTRYKVYREDLGGKIINRLAFSILTSTVYVFLHTNGLLPW